MSASGSNGIFGFGLQSAKGTLTTKWHRHRALDIDFGVQQEFRNSPPEIGGDLTPAGIYKAGVAMQGGASFQPRLEGDLGVILKALMGSVTSTPGTTNATAVHASFSVTASGLITGTFTNPPTARRLLFTNTGHTGGPAIVTLIGTDDTGAALTESGLSLTGATTLSTKSFKTVTSVNVTSTATAGTSSIGFYNSVSHVFKMATDQSDIPWLSVRKFIPGSLALGEIGQDCKITSMRLNFPQNGPVTLRLDVNGIGDTTNTNLLADDAAARAWTWVGAYEDFLSVPNTVVPGGGLLVPTISGSNLPITAFSMTWNNQMTGPQQEQIIGSPYMDDITTLGRSLAIQSTLKWNNADMYKRLLNAVGTEAAGWSAEVFQDAFTATAVSASKVTGTTPYSIAVYSPSVAFQGSSPRLQGGDLISMQVNGTAQAVSAGDYATITLVNAEPDYLNP